MAELSLKEEIAQTVYRKFMVLFCGDEEILKEIKIDSMFAKNVADSIISLMLAKVDKVKNPYFNRGGYDDTASSVGFNEALQAIKSILEGK